MEMVIKIDSQAFLASLQDVVRQIQAGCTQVTWQFGMQATEPTTPIHTLANEDNLETAVCPETEISQTDSNCPVTPDDSTSPSEGTHTDRPSGVACQGMPKQADRPYGLSVAKSATDTPEVVAQFDTATPRDVTQSATPTTLHVTPTPTLTPQALIQSATAMLQGNVAGAEGSSEKVPQGAKSTSIETGFTQLATAEAAQNVTVQKGMGSSDSGSSLGAQQEKTSYTQEKASYTLEGVRARLAHLMRRGEGAFVKAVLACYGATRLTQVAPKDYQEIMQKVGEKDAM